MIPHFFDPFGSGCLKQVGKTTLARQVAARRRGKVHWFDLEDHEVLERLREPLPVLRPLKGLVVLDEIQRRSELFPSLRVLIDRPRSPARFLILGSASPSLLKQSSESLAGRIRYQVLAPLSALEIGATQAGKLWLRGGFPRSFLARSGQESLRWRKDFIRDLLGRDLPALGVTIPEAALRRFLMMLCHRQASTWNSREFASSFGVADTTARSYLDLMAGTFMLRLLQPWHENISKRQVRAPKVYFRDSGIFHALLGLASMDQVLNHPQCGSSWEGWAIEQVMQRLGAGEDECFFWATHAGAELDLFIIRGGERLGFEFKRGSSPGLTSSMRSSMEALKLKELHVLHGGTESYSLSSRIKAMPLLKFLKA